MTGGHYRVGPAFADLTGPDGAVIAIFCGKHDGEQTARVIAVILNEVKRMATPEPHARIAELEARLVLAERLLETLGKYRRVAPLFFGGHGIDLKIAEDAFRAAIEGVEK